jgi:hypothetical protein
MRNWSGISIRWWWRKQLILLLMGMDLMGIHLRPMVGFLMLVGVSGWDGLLVMTIDPVLDVWI